MDTANVLVEKKPTCGIIMPISTIDGYPSEQWSDVLNILKDVCETSGFEAKLVSDADDIGVIHKRIVENIYSSDIIICDVSCKNSNVMFELGMRLAFDKPTIIVKDDITGYSFDTSLIEHLEYPKDLRFCSIIKFKENLSKKLIATYEKSKDPSYTTFLKNFGEYKVAHLEERVATSDTIILDAIEDLRREMKIIRHRTFNDNLSSERLSARSTLEREITIEDKKFVSDCVMEYIKVNNLRLKELDSSIDEIVTGLEKNKKLRFIAGNRLNLEKLVKESMDLF